ncbi:dihydroneopterin aldolase [Kingella negevensis]|uniref:7,8-dihydroneopterin aldolase n=1 Tax=Kingella negevensis TaxID=1522312 RepID=A0A238TCR1_9NEIS|nr:dihydroneopterin aldolase [Kingella negevensis]MDK4679873.1 dihydroneopterin aldolase [Kingella negevensis]MDK4682408.1 dihydroneopterin aldolase [Kingella negevensis]MDK4690605.1 dihydroneopterin aldolase [Kingella negevensis]MDK4692046.1 dihydroneopterin aldolase [Kingella negevensis]MDK4696196.1 dihydroneopterin aldolase [Kingella negevensis]
MDKIFLHGMKAETLIGVYDWERQHLQPLILDLDIGLPKRENASDDIATTIHYGEVCQTIREKLAQCQFQLLESLAEFIANLVLERFQAAFIRVRITKPGILPNVQAVGIEIERGTI